MKALAFPRVGAEPWGLPAGLTKFAWLSIAAAIVTIALKSGAYMLTGSVGLLSDVAESGVNLVAAVIAMVALRVAARPADHNHHFGHGKAEYFSAGAEGIMIFVAAAVILVSAAQRFLHPVALDSVGLGLAITTVASVVNGAAGVLLLRAGRAHRSVTLTADGKHLLTDVWTPVGVIIGVLLVVLTGWERLDPVVAALVGVNILITGYRLVSQSVTSLLDAALTDDDLARLTATLDGLRSADVDFAELRTRESGRFRFVSLTVLVQATGRCTTGTNSPSPSSRQSPAPCPAPRSRLISPRASIHDRTPTPAREGPWPVSRLRPCRIFRLGDTARH